MKAIRIIKERPILFSTPMVQAIMAGRKTMTRRVVKSNIPAGNWEETVQKCPYGQVGDRLWVRESWQAWTEFNATAPSDLPEEARQRINYPANGNTWDAKIRPSIHMPRWACRLVLEITNIRVERLQDISEADARAEGVKLHERGVKWLNYEDQAGGVTQFIYNCRTATDSFRTLWNLINGRFGSKAWHMNPWVWVVEFKVVEGGTNG